MWKFTSNCDVNLWVYGAYECSLKADASFIMDQMEETVNEED